MTERFLLSPYGSSSLPQYKGNLHTHTTQSDGPLAPRETIAEYIRRGYDFLMISDHDRVTDLSAFDDGKIILIRGNEITQNGMHLLHVNADTVLAPLPDRQMVIDAINRKNGFAVINHPNWGENFIHCAQWEIERLHDFVGIEIYNGVSERVEGNAQATDRWDMLLSKGRRVWGFGNDDNHHADDFGMAWNMVLTGDNTVLGLIEAMRKGSFYVSTGVRIDTIETTKGRLIIQSSDTQCFRIYRDHGMCLATSYGPELIYEIPDSHPLSYMRVECYGQGPQMAWTQPFFVQ